MSTQTQFPSPYWSVNSSRFVALVLTIGLFVLCAGSFDALFFADQFQQACAQIPHSVSCKGSQGAASELPTVQLAQIPPTPRPTIRTIPDEIRFVTSMQLNVRVQPGVGQDVLLVIDRNERVRLMGESAQVDGGMWVLIEVRGVQGWVNARHLRR